MVFPMFLWKIACTVSYRDWGLVQRIESSSTASLSWMVFYLQRIVGIQFVAV